MADFIFWIIVGLTIGSAILVVQSKKLVYSASSSCYGIPKSYPTNEKSEISPQYPYALTKYLGEQICLHWGKVYKIKVISLRLFNVYGTRSRTSSTYGAMFGTFLTQKLNKKPFTIVGDGSQSRDFTYVSDVVDVFIKAYKSKHPKDKILITFFSPSGFEIKRKNNLAHWVFYLPADTK